MGTLCLYFCMSSYWTRCFSIRCLAEIISLISLENVYITLGLFVSSRGAAGSICWWDACFAEFRLSNSKLGRNGDATDDDDLSTPRHLSRRYSGRLSGRFSTKSTMEMSEGLHTRAPKVMRLIRPMTYSYFYPLWLIKHLIYTPTTSWNCFFIEKFAV